MDLSLIVDWLGREGGDVLSFWLLATLAGLAVWPLLFRLLGGLPDRGYTLARIAGLMLTGFIFWFLGSLGMLRNTPGGMVFAWGLVLALSLVVFFRWDSRPSIRAWFREHRLLIVVNEVLFFGLLFGWAIFRAHNPDMGSTERPMEIMFLNGIRRSDVFPPNDPWLAGYAISYYYFGYVIAAMLSDLAGTSSGIGFNAMMALLFALTGTGALGIVYNMVRLRGGRFAAIGAGVLALCFVILMGNLGTALVELPYRGYTSGLVDEDYFDFWDVEEREGQQVIAQEAGEPIIVLPDSDRDTVPNWDDAAQAPANWGNWWWFRYSRVVKDRDLDGDAIAIQPITEFPSFSFVLSDMHPHVLALPFAMLAIGLALNLVLNGRALRAFEYPLYAIWVGGMIFTNSWDAIYLPLLIGAEALRRLVLNGNGKLTGHDLRQVGLFALIIGVLTVIFYSPWIISFTSQASGVLPNIIFPTPWQQFVLQFGVFLFILAVFLLVEVRRAGARFQWQAGLLALTMVLSFVLLMGVALGLSAWASDEVRNAVYQVVNDTNGLGNLLPDVFSRRLIGLPSELLLLGMIFVVVGRLFVRQTPHHNEAEALVPHLIDYSPATAFALLLVGAGAVLTFAPDFIYLHDNFGVRINTVFKLYYQGWLFFSLASAFAVWSVLSRMTVPLTPLVLVGRSAFAVVVTLLFIAGMVYPVVAARSRALVEDQRRLTIQEEIERCNPDELAAQGMLCPELPPLTLDGTPTMVNADELAAIQCLNELEQGSDAVVAEAPWPGGYNSQFGRFSGLTGIPTLMGWQNHEGQWRGDTFAAVTDARYENGVFRDRMIDIREMYTTQDWNIVWSVIDRYGIDYIVVGEAERQMANTAAGDNPSLRRDYDQGLAKFERVLAPVCSSGSTVVYRVAPR